MRLIKTIFATLIALLALAVCAFLFYRFHLAIFLPQWLRILMQILCGVGIFATLRVWGIAVTVRKNETYGKNNDKRGEDSNKE